MCVYIYICYTQCYTLFLYMFIYIHTCVFTCVFMCIYVYICVYMYICIYVCICIYIHIHSVYINLCTHTHVQLDACADSRAVGLRLAQSRSYLYRLDPKAVFLLNWSPGAKLKRADETIHAGLGSFLGSCGTGG